MIFKVFSRILVILNKPFSVEIYFYAKKVNITPQFIQNLLLVADIVTLKGFYLLLINFVWYTL